LAGRFPVPCRPLRGSAPAPVRSLPGRWPVPSRCPARFARVY